MRTSVKSTKRKRPAAAAAEVAVEPVAMQAATVEPVAAHPLPPVTEVASLDASAATPVVALPSVCTVKDAAALKQALCKVLEHGASVTLDIRSVERVDTAIFQLLYAFVRDRGQRNLGVAWLGAPEAMIDAATLLGMRAVLNLPEKESLGVAA